VKYKWIDGRPEEFFSFRIYKSEIANDTIMEIVDFAEERDIKDQSNLWDTQIEELKHQLGAG
jgi:two-component SAPR family response regulator